MGIFRVQTFKRIGAGRPWTNVYHVSAADLETAANSVNVILAPAEQSILSDTVTIFKAIVSDPDTLEFANLVFSLVGAQSGLGLLPLFNTMRAVFTVAGFGRNDAKFYRGYLGETNTEGGLIGSSAMSGAASILGALLGDMSDASTPLVDNLGNLWTGVAIQQAIQERQEHRRRRRV